MYLFHITDIESLKSIIKDGYLKSNKITGNINQGDGIYDGTNRFVYFSTTEKLFDPTIKHQQIILYFKSDFLYDRTFYTSSGHTPIPDKINEWKNGRIKLFRRKYNRYEKDYNIILKNLYDYSIKRSKKIFFIRQQIALLNKIKLKDNLIGIVFLSHLVDDTIIEYIKTNIPDVKIKIDLRKIYNW